MAAPGAPKIPALPKPSRTPRANAKGGSDSTAAIRSVATPQPKLPKNTRDYGKQASTAGFGFGPMGSSFGS